MALIPRTRLFGGRDRARRDEHAALKRKFALAAKVVASPREREAARDVGDLRRALAESVGSGSSCGQCARGFPLPEGHFDGGRCCGGPASYVFLDEEIDLLTLLGTRPKDLTRPRPAADAGCLFRGRTGCSLAPGHRPTICIHYICSDLMAEAAAADQATVVAAVQDRLKDAMKTYITIRQERRLDEDFADAFGEALSAPGLLRSLDRSGDTQ